MSETQVDQAGIERTPAGEIVDQTPSPEPKTEPTTPETPKTEVKAEPKTESKDGETLLSKPNEPAKPEGAPEKYEDFKVPEGYELDKEVAGKAGNLFKELGLSQDQAQKAVDFYRELTEEAQKQPFEMYQKLRNDWREEANNHPQLRGRLTKDGPVQQAFGKLLDGLGDAQLANSFREAMDITGAGDHPAFIRVIDILAHRLTEGAHVSGSGPSAAGQAKPGAGPQSAAKALYPNLP